MFKDLLVATTGLGDDQAAFDVAATLAEAASGHVAVLVQTTAPTPQLSTFGLPDVSAYLTMIEQAHRAGEAACAVWRGHLARRGVPGEVRQADNLLSSPPRTASLQAHYADLTVVGRAAPGGQPKLLHDQFASLVAESGRPVLAVPAGHRGRIGLEHVVIAWRPTPQAARAVHDALPFLKRAGTVHVLCVDPRPGEGEHGEDPGADIARHLARHELGVTVHVEVGSGDEPGEVLLRRCRELGAGLLVMGAYGRSRLQEAILGGTTRHVFQHAGLPVLFAH